MSATILTFKNQDRLKFEYRANILFLYRYFPMKNIVLNIIAEVYEESDPAETEIWYEQIATNYRTPISSMLEIRPKYKPRNKCMDELTNCTQFRKTDWSVFPSSSSCSMDSQMMFSFPIILLFTEEREQARKHFCKDMFDHKAKRPNFTNEIVTVFEVWFSNEQIKRSAADARNFIGPVSTEKKLFICFYDSRGIIYFTCVHKKDYIRETYYFTVLKKFFLNIYKYRPEYIETGSWYFMVENIWPYNTIAVRRYLADRKVILIEYPAYSQNFPWYYSLLLQIESDLPLILHGDVESEYIWSKIKKYNTEECFSAFMHEISTSKQ